MAWQTQGSGSNLPGSALRRVRPVLLAAAASLAGCAGGVDLRKAEIDDSLITASVADGPARSAVRASDETTIRNAVSAADPAGLRAGAIAWANAATGSRGAITDLVEINRNGGLCRRFRATRESFDGVAVHRGETCLARDGLWQMVAFEDA